jgi:hypothetical protein
MEKLNVIECVLCDSSKYTHEDLLTFSACVCIYTF